MPDSYRDRYEARTEIARRRQRMDITQVELARRAGLSETTLQRLESGADANPRIVTLLAVASALHCELVDMVEEQWRQAADRQRRLEEEAVRDDLLKPRQQRRVDVHSP